MSEISSDRAGASTVRGPVPKRLVQPPRVPRCCRSVARAFDRARRERRIRPISTQAGQISSIAAAMIALMLAAVGGLALIGAAVIDRHAATVASDSVAIAAAMDASAGDAVAQWYEDRSVTTVRPGDGSASATTDTSRATSRAVSDDRLTDAPAVIAVVARARQMLNDPLTSAAISGITVTFNRGDARRFETVADDLVMCEVGTTSTSGARRTWRLC